ncbi:diacylglycerol/lipid kinase family protein [Paludisphaera borealis]|uniref:Diacylglycerol kinase n=1 Tax=Paludisphaera borealis TaxID=1387353 RepID=A0A1U7CXA5_9BACT|nr:diacylglycerol kinase family protein [Paludisphaera borealis]APW63565.1 Diacylglycerol kinase [Paludisphaera borealis]
MTHSVGANQEEGPPAPRDASAAVTKAGWVGVVVNRSSGKGSGPRLVERLADALGDYQLGAKIAWTPAERKAMVARADGDPSCRCLVVVGGDGTVSALVNEKLSVPLTVLRAGTENLAAQHFELRGNPRWLAHTIATGKAVPVDLGRANGRRFILMTGFGFDGDVVTRHHDMRTSRTGAIRTTHRAAYVEPILRSSLSYRFPEITARIEDPGAEETLVGTTVFVFNLPRYALGLPFAPDASQDDGFLDLVVFRDPGPLQALYYLWKVVIGTHLDHPGVYHRRVRRVNLTASGTVPVQLDGDPAGYLLPVAVANSAVPSHSTSGLTAATTRDHWTIEAVPGAVQVLVAETPASGVNGVALASERGFR